jgi:hypothetical protein
VLGFAPLKDDLLREALQLGVKERSDCIIRLSESTDFYALVSSVLLLGRDKAEDLKPLLNVLRNAIREAEALKRILENRKKKGLSFKERAMERIGFLKDRRQPWAGLGTGFTRRQQQEIDKRAQEIGGGPVEQT